MNARQVLESGEVSGDYLRQHGGFTDVGRRPLSRDDQRERSPCMARRSRRQSTAQVTVMGDMLRAYGEFLCSRADYGIKPVSVAGGALKLKDEIEVYVRHRGASETQELRRTCAWPFPERSSSLLAEDRDLAMVDVLGVRRKVDSGCLQEDVPAPAIGC